MTETHREWVERVWAEYDALPEVQCERDSLAEIARRARLESPPEEPDVK